MTEPHILTSHLREQTLFGRVPEQQRLHEHLFQAMHGFGSFRRATEPPSTGYSRLGDKLPVHDRNTGHLRGTRCPLAVICSADGKAHSDE